MLAEAGTSMWCGTLGTKALCRLSVTEKGIAPVCAAYTGLTVDIDRIRLENNARTGVERKAGLIIWSGRESSPHFCSALR